MDKSLPGKETPEEVARESLIAISYSLPEHSSNKLNGENLSGEIDDNEDEKHRSKLISISYTQSPDTGGLPVAPEGRPVAPGELKG